MKTKYFALISLLIMSLVATSCTTVRNTDIASSSRANVQLHHEVKPVFEL